MPRETLPLYCSVWLHCLFCLPANPHATLLFPRLVLQDFTDYQNMINAFGRTKSLVRHEMDPCAY